MHTLGISGSVIMSDTSRFQELFIEDIQHVEIGEFEGEVAFKTFLKLAEENNVSFGLHSPLYRNESKYDLIEYVQYEPEKAWEQFENEMKRMVEARAAYILVHFPYFKGGSTNPIETIEHGLKRLAQLQKKYDLPIICEPKLGLDRSSKGIEYLDQFPVSLWERYGLKLCIDIGDYVLAGADVAFDRIQKWKPHIKVVHLHNVEFHDDKYIWTPIHPSHESDGIHFPIKQLLNVLSECKDLYWILEHTPHTNPTNQFVMEGLHWLQDTFLNSKK